MKNTRLLKLFTSKQMKFCLSLLAIASISTHIPFIANAAEKLTITSKLIDFSAVNPTQEIFDELLWRGGLVLESTHSQFGGLSGIELSANGEKMLAISDRGFWVKADVIYKNGRISGLANSLIAPILNANGKKFVRWKADSEGLTKRNDSLSDVVISVESDQAIYRFKLGNDDLNARAMDWGTIKDAKKIAANRGLEAITALPKNHKYRGWMLVAAEHKLDKNKNHTAWLVNGKQSHELHITRQGGYDITDLNYLPNGDILLLERAISIFGGPQMQIRQICGKDVKPGALMSGKSLLRASGIQAVDNMEGIGVHIAANGEVILTVISDDNFHFLQRNLMLQFTLRNPASICE
ncbi:MAG: esterase-like activity of phytase family protein [Alphaproteobacteria bacterium]|nr:esterase-like activity of phytase family protein [Alphaproteobacteria bacterium]